MWHITRMGAGKRFSAELGASGDAAAVLAAALATVDRFATLAALDPRPAARIAVIVEEVLANALRHGSAQKVSFELAIDPPRVAMTFSDDGIAFDPTAPRTFAGPDPETGGGVGLALLRSWSEELAYERSGGCNRLRVMLPLNR